MLLAPRHLVIGGAAAVRRRHVVVLPGAPVPPAIAAMGLMVQHEFASEAEECALVREVDARLAELPYQSTHTDKIISGFRECGVEDFGANADAAEAVRRVRQAAWQATMGAARRGAKLYPHTQLIDMHPDGEIHAHRDNLHLFGEFTAGLNLASSAVLRFRPCDARGAPDAAAEPIDVVLLPRSLYVMHGALRWEHTHEVLDRAGSAAVWGGGERVQGGGGEAAEGGGQPAEYVRGRRISAIVRDRSAASGFLSDVYYG